MDIVEPIISNNKDIKVEYNIERSNMHNKKEIKIISNNSHKNPENPIIKYDSEDINLIINNNKGIDNIGNTCFINFIVQILFHCKKFIEMFLSNIDIIHNKTYSVSYKFYEILNCIIENNKEIGFDTLDISNFINVFMMKHINIEIGQQNDCQEFLRLLLEDFNYEMNRIKHQKKYTTFYINSNLNKKDNSFRFSEFFKRSEDSIINDLFYIQIVNNFICSCGYESYSFEKLTDITLLFPNKNKPEYSLYSLLDLYFNKIPVLCEKECIKCKKNTIHSKFTKLSFTPEILIISIERIKFEENLKNYSDINYEDIINLKDYVDKDIIYIGNVFYKLFGLIVHYGDLNFGHYITIIKYSNNNYIEFNDDKVYINENYNIEKKKAYSLFYEKI